MPKTHNQLTKLKINQYHAETDQLVAEVNNVATINIADAINNATQLMDSIIYDSQGDITSYLIKHKDNIYEIVEWLQSESWLHLHEWEMDFHHHDRITLLAATIDHALEASC
jgi:hypothetical protein